MLHLLFLTASLCRASLQTMWSMSKYYMTKVYPSPAVSRHSYKYEVSLAILLTIKDVAQSFMCLKVPFQYSGVKKAV